MNRSPSSPVPTGGAQSGIAPPLTVTDHPDDNPLCHLEAVIEPGLLNGGRNKLGFALQPPAYKVPSWLKPQPGEVRKVNLEIVYRDETHPYWLAVQLHRKEYLPFG